MPLYPPIHASILILTTRSLLFTVRLESAQQSQYTSSQEDLWTLHQQDPASLVATKLSYSASVAFHRPGHHLFCPLFRQLRSSVCICMQTCRCMASLQRHYLHKRLEILNEHCCPNRLCLTIAASLWQSVFFTSCASNTLWRRHWETWPCKQAR